MEDALLENGNRKSSSEGMRGCKGWCLTFANYNGHGKLMKEEVKKLGYLAVPMVAVMVLQFMVQIISNMIVGHLSEVDLASAAIATSFTNVTGFSLLVGMASALDTLCGQAFGAKQYQMVGIHTYRAIICLLLVCIPIALVWCSIEQLLSYIGQDPLIALKAEKYALWMIPGLCAYAIVQPQMKFLQSQSLIIPMLLVSFTTLCLHIPLCWVLVFKSSLGNIGAAISISISYWLNLCMTTLYIRYSDTCKATRAPFTRDAVKGIKKFLRLAIPSAIMICLEWWSYELLILLSGLLPNPKLETSVLAIVLNTAVSLYTMPYGLGSAASTRVSNELGSGNAEGAKLAVHVTIILAVSVAAILSGTLLATRRILGYAYSSEEEVVSYVGEIIPLLAIQVISDNIQGTLSGIARGCGWQHLGAYVNLGAFYLVGLPMAVLLGFKFHMRGKGLWMGILCGSMTQSTLLSLITIFTDWQKQANSARERILDESLPLLNESK